MNPFAAYSASVHNNGLRTSALHIALPIVFGAVALIPGGIPAFQSQIVSVVAIVAGLLFSMLVLLIDLRGKIRRGEEKRAAPGDRDTSNLDYAYEATNYTIIIGFTLAALLIVQQQTSDALASAVKACPAAGWVTVAANWLLYGLAAHFGLAAMHCLRRLRRAYTVFGIGNR